MESLFARRLAVAVLLGVLVAPAATARAAAPNADPNLAAQRAKAQERMALDRSLLSPEDLRNVEALYQSANRDPRSPEAKQALLDLVKRYPLSNRAGCALLYLAQLSSGSEREEALKRAIADYGNSWYGDGVQVGAMARAQLAVAYANSGRIEEARRLAEELRAQFPGAVDHSGGLLIDGLQALKPAPGQ